MNQTTRYRTFSALLFAAAFAALLAIGALKLQRDFNTRGIPTGLPAPARDGGARLGLNVSLAQYDDETLQDQLSQIAQTGVGYVKQTFFFSDSFDWGEAERLTAAVHENGLILVPLLDGNPANDFAPVDPQIFAGWAAEFADRYGANISHYIIWDEPNLSSHWGWQPVNASEYAALLTAAARQIRLADADAVIVAAPLAPTIEGGPQNLADPLFLQQIYEAGAADSFDVAAGKPYGFDSDPGDRIVSQSALNFSRIVLLREVMARNGDQHKAIWAGNWGWNSLPGEWQGAPSIWGQTSSGEQAARTVSAFQRARLEWPWMGVMFLENWQPDASADDPRWGFSIAGRETAEALQSLRADIDGGTAYPGFHLASAGDPAQQYSGGWRFSPEYGADISQSGDEVTFTFWGTDAGLRVRRADFRARLYITVDGKPANALPHDENGSTLVLTSADTSEDYISTEWVARDLPAGKHTMKITAARGWEQWALNGFHVGYRPSDNAYRWQVSLLALAAALGVWGGIRLARKAQWGSVLRSVGSAFARLGLRPQLLLTVTVALLVGVTGWLTWGQQADGLYRRLGDGGQLALTAVAASVFYITPSFFVYALALMALFVLVYLRPAWGVALIAFSMPFYPYPKEIFSYRFSPVEVFTLLTAAAALLAWWRGRLALFKERQSAGRPLLVIDDLHPRRLLSGWHRADFAVAALVLVASASLLFTERLDVAANEWRWLIVEPALFYLLLRSINPSRQEMWVILDAFVLSGLVVALYGLWQYATGQNLITAEGGLMRLRSFYGSPNNVGLYLGRILPFLAAMALLGTRSNGRRRWAYLAMLFPVGLAILLSFSRGALVLGVPAALLVIFWRWQTAGSRKTWPWMVGFGAAGAVGIFLLQLVPQLAGRFNLQGATSVFRVNLWRASLNMVADHPLFGVGLDNFLYAYRGRYILDAAWQEPNLSHPHNLVLDFATRLGLLGLLVGIWMIWQLVCALRRQVLTGSPAWMPVKVGIMGALADMLAHGLVDHGFFLIDLSLAFYLMLALALWIGSQFNPEKSVLEKA